MASALRGKGKGVVVWALLALLVLGLGGFGVTNFGGSSQSVATVGGEEIGAKKYGRAVQNELYAMSAQTGQQLTFQQAQSVGIDRAVLARLIGQAALDEKAHQIGVSAGDDQVREQIVKVAAFKGIDGKFDRDLYAQALKRLGMNEGEFEGELRADSARSLLQSALVAGVKTPATYVDTVAGWASERRGFTYATLTADQLTAPVPAPTDDQLKSYLDAHKDQFTVPETRHVEYAWLSPEMLLGKVKLDDKALREAYEARKDEFVQPEKRMVERLVFGSQDEAKAAKAEIDSGKKSFADLVKERGLTLDDVDLGEVSKADLGKAGAGVFALSKPGVTGPLPSDLGPALFAMNGIIAAQNMSFDEARSSLSEEAAMDRARRMIDNERQKLDDALAGGATVKQLADENGMEYGKADVTAEGTGQGVAGYKGFREAALAAQEGDFPELHSLEDGGVFALILDKTDPPRTQTLDEAREAVTAAWKADQQQEQLMALAKKITEAPDFEAAATAMGVTPQQVTPARRDGFVEALPQDGVKKIFALKAKGDTTTMAGKDPATAIAVRLDSITRAAADDEDAQKTREALDQQTSQSIAQDMLRMYVKAAQDDAGVAIHQNVINAVNTQMP